MFAGLCSPSTFGAATRPLAAGVGPLGPEGGRIVSLWRFIFSWFNLEEEDEALKPAALNRGVSNCQFQVSVVLDDKKRKRCVCVQ